MNNQIKWHGQDGIDPSWNNSSPEDYSDYKQLIFEKVSFANILFKLKLRPIESSAGKYTHKMICPFLFHKNGRERTSSFYINEKNKTFVCYGCLMSGDLLKFLQIYVGGDEQYHLKKLASLVGLTKNNSIQIPEGYVFQENTIPQETNYKYLYQSGLLLRDYLAEQKNDKRYKKECKWVDDTFVKLDSYFEMIEDSDTEAAQTIYNNLKKTIESRKI